MFQEFSGSYYLGRLYVEPHEGDTAVLHEEYHEQANERVYADGDGLERLDYPLVMKLDGTHFPVHATGDVPTGTLGVPEKILEHVRVEEPPAVKEVLLAKSGWAQRLVTWFGAGPLDGGFETPQ